MSAPSKKKSKREKECVHQESAAADLVETLLVLNVLSFLFFFFTFFGSFRIFIVNYSADFSECLTPALFSSPKKGSSSNISSWIPVWYCSSIQNEAQNQWVLIRKFHCLNKTFNERVYYFKDRTFCGKNDRCPPGGTEAKLKYSNYAYSSIYHTSNEFFLHKTIM